METESLKKRLNKYISETGICSRRGADKLIEEGKVIVVENPSYQGLLKMVLHGRIHGAYINPNASRYILTHELKLPDSLLILDERLPITKGFFNLSTVKHPNIVKEFNIWLEENNSLTIALFRKYGIQSWK